MAAAYLSPPGSKRGPCVGDCRHVDCQMVRAEAASNCRLCGNAIGYEMGHYSDPENCYDWVHAACLEDAIDAERAAKEPT